MKNLKKFYFNTVLLLFSYDASASFLQIPIQDNEVIEDKMIISTLPHRQQYNLSYSMLMKGRKVLLCSPDYGSNPSLPLKVMIKKEGKKISEQIIILCSWSVKLPAEQINATAYELKVFDMINGAQVDIKNTSSCKNLFSGFDGVVNGEESHYLLANESHLSEDKLDLINDCIDSSVVKKILVKKAFLSQKQNNHMKKTKMYLIKGDEVGILQKQNDFYEIEYNSNRKGKIKAWLHCSAIDACR